ncbi:MAG: hypothetical protein GF418_10890 [Chitinivibrionales bacterium]|nr:hypothetical protein [Chitinivibrionales bacterium]MBD3396121.1 hypothetical protein [Chitinivibrionales bacterium]
MSLSTYTRMLLFIGCVVVAGVLAAPQPGQIAIDPDHPGRMVYHDTYISVGGRQILKPCVFAGPGDPEDFFYNNTDANIDLLVGRGARCTYITAYLADFGGGSPGTGTALDNTLDIWEQKITELENAGIITVFFFYDDSYARPSGWEIDVERIVNKLEHHKLLIWSVAEEYSEALSSAAVKEVAARIKAVDDYDHIVGVHQLSSTSFDFNSDSNLEMFLVQYNQGDAGSIHSGFVSAWNNVGGNAIVNCAEIADHAKQDRATVRQWNWAALMGGASAIQVLWMGRVSDEASWNEQGKYDDCATLTDFAQSTTINEMVPRDDLAAGSSRWVLAREGVSYIAYTDNLVGDMGVKGMRAGTYSLQWLDIDDGSQQTTTENAADGENTFLAPSGIDGEVAVWIYGGSTEPSVPSSVSLTPSSVTIQTGATQQFTATVKDQYGQSMNGEAVVWSLGGGGSVSASGEFTSDGTEGEFTVTATAQSHAGLIANATVTVTADIPAPTANDQHVTVAMGQTAAVSLSISSSTSGPYAYTVTAPPAHGSVSLAGNDATYTPDEGFSGSDAFTWIVTDQSTGKASNEATVSLTVQSAAGDEWAYLVEAEQYSNIEGGGWVEENSTSGYSGTGYMKVTGSGKVHYTVNFPQAGTYYLYIRNYATNSQDNGVHLEISGSAVTPSSGKEAIYAPKIATFNWAAQWQCGEGCHCGPLDIEIPSAGEHTVTLVNREDNFKLDRIAVLKTPLTDGQYCGYGDVSELNVLNEYANGCAAPSDVVAASVPQPGARSVISVQRTAYGVRVSVQEAGAHTFELTDMLGRTIARQCIQGMRMHTLPVDMGRGVYFLRVQSRDGVAVRKLSILR